MGDKRAYFILIGAIILVVGMFLGLNIKKSEQSTSKNLEQVDFQDINEKKIHAVSVAIDNEGRGVSLDLITEVKPGSGQVLVNINDVLADITTQYSARLAAEVASKIADVDLSKVDIFYNIMTNASVVAGGSAGSAMAVSTIAALEDKELKPDVVITGSIDENGNVVSAGGIREKAKAAKSRGAKLFLVPKDSGEVSGYARKTECKTFFDITYCEVKHVTDTTDFPKDLGIEIKEVSNIKEALEYFL